MSTDDRDYDGAQRGYGGAEADVNENTPPQEQQQPEHGGREAGDATADEPERSETDESGPGRGTDR
jgi:hypothetical protein